MATFSSRYLKTPCRDAFVLIKFSGHYTITNAHAERSYDVTQIHSDVVLVSICFGFQGWKGMR